MAAAVPSKAPNLRQEEELVKPERVFGSHEHPVDEFELLIQRVVRRHILQQYNEKGDIDSVIASEDALIDESTAKVSQHLQATSNEWNNIAFRLRKIAIIRHLRELAKERLKDHVETQDLDEEIAKTALETIFTVDFEWIFPKSWVDG